MTKYFREEEHPRDKDGKFTDGNGTNQYRQNVDYSSIVIKSGAKSGALDSEGKDFNRAVKHAEIMYNTYRNIKSDVPKIAKVTGFTEEEILRVKNHMFFNEYDLDDGHHRFHPDFDQAQSWDRLWRGVPREMDYVMIRHELAEEPLMRKGMSYRDAHKEANKTANYEKAIKEYKDAEAKKKGN